jgi:hypothetical protein
MLTSWASRLKTPRSTASIKSTKPLNPIHHQIEPNPKSGMPENLEAPARAVKDIARLEHDGTTKDILLA